MASPWPATGTAPGANTRRPRRRRTLFERRIDREGYVSTHQHQGFGHGEGWPFPTWSRAGGIGWRFATEHLAYRTRPVRAATAWQPRGLRALDLDVRNGRRPRVEEPVSSLTTPPFGVYAGVAPSETMIRISSRGPGTRPMSVLLPPGVWSRVSSGTPEGPAKVGKADRGSRVRLPVGPNAVLECRR